MGWGDAFSNLFANIGSAIAPVTTGFNNAVVQPIENMFTAPTSGTTANPYAAIAATPTASTPSLTAINPVVAPTAATAPQSYQNQVSMLSQAPNATNSNISSVLTSLGLMDAKTGQVNMKALADLYQAYQKYQLQQTLQDPSQVSKNASKLFTGLSPALTRGLNRQVDAEMQERGLTGAPGLYSEALAEAKAPYIYQGEQAALQEYLQSIGLSEGMYNQGGPLGDFSNFLTQLKLNNP